MKAKPIGIVVAVLAAIAAGAGALYLAQSSTRPTDHSRPRDADPALQIESLGGEELVESGIEGYRDFRFQNPQDRPLTVGVEAKNCRCASIHVATLPEDAQRLDAPALRQCIAKLPLSWEKLEAGGPTLTIPPRAIGIVRLGWKAEKVGDQLFWAGLSLDNGSRQGFQRLEVALQFVEPVRIRPEAELKKFEANAGRLNAGEERTIQFLCFSFTRAQFALAPAASSKEPCMVRTAAQPLTKEELDALSSKTRRKVLSGYRAGVTVRERAGGARLDLGPFHRKIVWKTDVTPGHEISMYVNGVVRGEVKLAGAEDKQVVELGKVAPSSPSPVTFTLESDDPNLGLVLDEDKSLEFLKVEMLDGPEGTPAGKGKTWRIRVVFSTDSLFRGRFPVQDRAGYDSDMACCLVFFISRQGEADPKLRRIFVPVRGLIQPGN